MIIIPVKIHSSQRVKNLTAPNRGSGSQMDLGEIKMKIEKNQQYMPHQVRQPFDWRSLQYFMKGFVRGLDEYDSEEQPDRLKRKGRGMGF